MEKVLKEYKFRMYPTEEQMNLIEKSFGCSRYIYNYFLKASENKKYIKAFDYIKELPSLSIKKEWLKEVDSCLLRCSIFNLEDSFNNYNKGISKYPKYKSKHKNRSSYRTNNITSTYKGKTYNSISIDLERKIIKLPKLKEVRIRGYRKLKGIIGRIINATIYKEADKYYVSVCVEENKIIDTVIPNKIIGIDLGIKELLTTSDGITIENKKYIEKYEKKIAGLNRWLSRCKAGSKNRYKVKKKLQEVYSKIRNARKYFLHQITRQIVEDNDIIVTEALNINQMVQNKNLSKKIYDASWYELIRQLCYKSKWRGKKYYQIDRYYPSSQECSSCGYRNKELKDLSIRKWECPECHSENERDVNASINIMWEGIKKYIEEKKELQVI